MIQSGCRLCGGPIALAKSRPLLSKLVIVRVGEQQQVGSTMFHMGMQSIAWIHLISHGEILYCTVLRRTTATPQNRRGSVRVSNRELGFPVPGPDRVVGLEGHGHKSLRKGQQEKTWMESAISHRSLKTNHLS